MKKAYIRAIEYYLPEAILDNNALALLYPEYPATKILAKTGIKERHIAAAEEFASDMAIQAAEKLFQNTAIAKTDIDILLFCTQTPDYLLPTTACIIQEKLGLSTSIGAYDINLGCSGFVYGIATAKAFIESGQANNVLLLNADTYTKLIEATDKSVRTIFGDGAAATLISGRESTTMMISATAFGTNGAGAKNLCVLGQGLREFGKHMDPYLRMKGPKIFEFTLEVVPKVIENALTKANMDFAEIELFVFHQANAYMLEHLRKKLTIPEDKFWVAMDFCGNTVSATIPIALKEAWHKGMLVNKRKIMLVGFGVGYSWAANIVDLTGLS